MPSLVERGLDKAVETLMEGVGDDEADAEIDGGVDETLAQLLQVLHQAHAGELRALGDGVARFVDGFLGINHDAQPAPIFRLQGKGFPGIWRADRRQRSRQWRAA